MRHAFVPVHKLKSLLFAAWLAGTSGCAFSAVNYISSGGGLMLHMAGDDAVLAPWGVQSPVQGFSGFGQVHLAGRCLTGRQAGQQLRWEGCRGGDQAQVWSLSRGTLVNQQALCAQADAGGGQPHANVAGVACSGDAGQRWNSYSVQSAQRYAARITDPRVRAAFVRTARSAGPGTFISVTTGLPLPASPTPPEGSVIATGGANVIAQSGQ
ncbi:MAG: hypothetical protein V4731_10715 [Pseudomonadota bacterium]